MATTQLVAAPGVGPGAGMVQVVPELIALCFGVLATNADIVGNVEAMGVGNATLLVEWDGYCALLNLFRAGESGGHEAGGHEGEEDGLEGHEHVCVRCGRCVVVMNSEEWVRRYGG